MVKDKSSPLLEVQARLELVIPNRKVLEAVIAALTPETIRAPTERSISKINVNKDKVIIEIYAFDLTSLRAAINSYFRWIVGISKSISVIRKWLSRKD